MRTVEPPLRSISLQRSGFVVLTVPRSTHLTFNSLVVERFNCTRQTPGTSCLLNHHVTWTCTFLPLEVNLQLHKILCSFSTFPCAITQTPLLHFSTKQEKITVKIPIISPPPKKPARKEERPKRSELPCRFLFTRKNVKKKSQVQNSFQI